MEVNRNQYFLAGLVLLLLGLQLRLTDSVVLTPRCTKFIAQCKNHPVLASTNGADVLVGAEAKLAGKTVRPPEWIGWAFLSLGSVLILHSLAMTRPE